MPITPDKLIDALKAGAGVDGYVRHIPGMDYGTPELENEPDLVVIDATLIVDKVLAILNNDQEHPDAQH